jgi:hypothetical protein
MPTEFTVTSALEQLNPNYLADALRRLHIGLREAGVKVAVAASVQTPAVGRGTIESPKVTVATVVATFDPPIAAVKALRVTSGAATGGRILLDAAGTAAQIGTSGVYAAVISDDGSTITFEATITGFVISYIPRLSAADLAAKFYPLT